MADPRGSAVAPGQNVRHEAPEWVSLRVRLQLSDATVLVISNVIGVGIFTTPAIIASLAPNPVMILALWAAGGLITPLLALALAGSISAMTIAGSRVYFAMDRDRVFPAALGRAYAKFGTPASAIALQAAWSILPVAFGSFEEILLYADRVMEKQPRPETCELLMQTDAPAQRSRAHSCRIAVSGTLPGSLNRRDRNSIVPGLSIHVR